MQNYQKNSRKIGDIGEQATADFLLRHGYEILRRNYTVRGGEIDIIARKGIVAAAQRFIDEVKSDCEQCRFDVAVVTVSDKTVTHLKYYVDAFDGSN